MARTTERTTPRHCNILLLTILCLDLPIVSCVQSSGRRFYQISERKINQQFRRTQQDAAESSTLTFSGDVDKIIEMANDLGMDRQDGGSTVVTFPVEVGADDDGKPSGIDSDPSVVAATKSPSSLVHTADHCYPIACSLPSSTKPASAPVSLPAMTTQDHVPILPIVTRSPVTTSPQDLGVITFSQPSPATNAAGPSDLAQGSDNLVLITVETATNMPAVDDPTLPAPWVSIASLLATASPTNQAAITRAPTTSMPTMQEVTPAPSPCPSIASVSESAPAAGTLLAESASEPIPSTATLNESTPIDGSSNKPSPHQTENEDSINIIPVNTGLPPNDDVPSDSDSGFAPGSQSGGHSSNTESLGGSVGSEAKLSAPALPPANAPGVLPLVLTALPVLAPAMAPTTPSSSTSPATSNVSQDVANTNSSGSVGQESAIHTSLSGNSVHPMPSISPVGSQPTAHPQSGSEGQPPSSGTPTDASAREPSPSLPVAQAFVPVGSTDSNEATADISPVAPIPSISLEADEANHSVPSAYPPSAASILIAPTLHAKVSVSVEPTSSPLLSSEAGSELSHSTATSGKFPEAFLSPTAGSNGGVVQETDLSTDLSSFTHAEQMVAPPDAAPSLSPAFAAAQLDTIVACGGSSLERGETIEFTYSLETASDDFDSIESIRRLSELTLSQDAANLLLSCDVRRLEADNELGFEGIDHVPEDTASETSCGATVDITNDCTVFDGILTVYISEEADFELAKYYTLTAIREALGLLDGQVPGLDKAMYLGPDIVNPSAFATSKIGDGNVTPGPSDLNTSLVLFAVGGCAFAASVGLIYYLRRNGTYASSGAATQAAGSDQQTSRLEQDRPLSPFSEMLPSAYRFDQDGNMSAILELDDESATQRSGIVVSDSGFTTEDEGSVAISMDGMSSLNNRLDSPVLGARKRHDESLDSLLELL